jgi:hypothetical protein
MYSLPWRSYDDETSWKTSPSRLNPAIIERETLLSILFKKTNNGHWKNKRTYDILFL